MASAISSLPVPVSPLINTVESVGATSRTMPRTLRRAVLVPIIVAKSLPPISLSSNVPFADAAPSSSKDEVRFIARVSFAQLVCADISLLPYEHPFFWIKYDPLRIALQLFPQFLDICGLNPAA